ncbi:MAG: FdhF/YdeP family oxidoreductase [Acidobacteria bacterium]|nr:FdhF/YdeP family oxidoreductase [Acidobacteriota bacterium]
MKKSNKQSIARLKVGEAKKTAAGISAVVNATRVVLRQTGLIRGSKLLRALNQKGGIDCNSCAWADPEGERTHAEFCENGAKAIADEATTKRVTPEFFAKYSVDDLTGMPDQWLNAQGRITEPMILDAGASHYKPISWEEALAVVSDELNALGKPDEAVFYTSGRTSNEAAFLYQLFVRCFGTNNLPDCSNMCHESTSVALAESIGLGKATVRLEDLENTDLILIIGQNPGTNAPRMMSSLQKAKQNGARIIAVNPLREAGFMSFLNPNPEQYADIRQFPMTMLKGRATALADVHLPIRIGGDLAFLKGVIKIILEREKRSPAPLLDYDFINSKTEGFQDFVAGIESVDWETIVAQSGLSIAQIEATAEAFLDAERVVTCWAMGVTQHKQAVAAVQEIANLHFLRGQIGRQDTGLCPVRGHSNVQGDRSMGIWESMNPTFRKNLEKEFHFKAPKRDGFDTVEAIRAMHSGAAKVFFALGGNFLSASPDTDFTADALRNCNLNVQVITKLNRTALVTGKRSLILPCLGRTEIDMTGGKGQFGSTESTMLNVQMSKGILEPASEHLRSEVWIVAKLAQAVLKNRMTFDWERFVSDYDLIRDSISRVVPGCENYNQRIRVDGGFYMPNPPRERVFPTASGLARFSSSHLEEIKLADGELLMTTIRAHDQFNTTVYEENDRYRGIRGSRRVIFMNSSDIAARGLKAGDVVDLTSFFDGVERRAETFVIVPYDIPKDCCATYFPEANPLVPIGSVADRSNCPTSKSVKIRVVRHE